MFNTWNTLNDQTKGLILVVVGSVLLLHTLGVIQKGLNVLIILSSLYMIGLGLVKLDAINKFADILRKK